jgi:hypothetical protein
MKCFTNDSAKRKAQNSKCKAFALSFALLALRFELLWACPLCKEALTTGMAKGFFWSILLMLSAPFLVVGTIAGVLWRAGRRQKRALPDVRHE